MRRRARRGLGLVSVLVIVALSFGAISLVVIGLSQARENARREQCLSNMRQIGLSAQAYESRSSSSYYPGYKNYRKISNGKSYKAYSAPYPASQIGRDMPISWIIELLPYYGDGNHFTPFHGLRNGADRAANIEINEVYPFVEFFTCPSDLPPTQDRAPLSYVANTGMRDANVPGQRDYRANGVFHDHYTDNPELPENAGKKNLKLEQVGNAYIGGRGDGVQFTILLSENIDAGSYLDTDERFLGITWAVPKSVTPAIPNEIRSATPPDLFRHINIDPARQFSLIERPNTPDAKTSQGTSEPIVIDSRNYEDDDSPYFYYTRPSSNHAGGVNVTFCDAHGMFMSDKIDYHVYMMLLSPDGKNVVDTRTGKPVEVNGELLNPKLLGFDRAWISDPVKK